MIRLDKYLADMGIGTRSEVKRLIRQGQVKVDGVVCRLPEQKLEQESAEVLCGGKPIVYQKFYYYMFHKPAGVVTAKEDTKEKTVMDVLREQGLSCPAFATGIVCSDFTALPAELELLRVEGGESEILLHLEEGKFHQVKRMVQAVGKEVLYLKRLSMGALRLDDALQPGEWRELTKEEKEALGCQEKKG